MKKKRVLIPIIIFTVVIIILIIVFNSSHKLSSLSISESKWDSIIDTRTENSNLKLTSIEFNDFRVIIDETDSTLYYSLLKSNKNKYDPVVSYSSKSKIKLAFLEDEITDEKVKSDYRFKIMIYTEKEYHIYNLKCTDLPILSITYSEESNSKPKNTPMELYLFDNLSDIPKKITKSEGRIRENKDGYEISLDMLTPGKNRRDNRISLLNMKPSNEYKLVKANDMDRNRRVELFINNEYKGVYSLSQIEERIPQANDNMR